MRIIVDARPMAEPIRGGVGRVALELVVAFASSNPKTEVVCATTGTKAATLPERLTSCANVRHLHLKIPNKPWSLASMLGLASLCGAAERRCGHAGAFFMPNLGFMGRLPQGIPSVLLLHDLSFLIEPRWFTPKQRLWHHAVKAKKLIRGATRLIAVSETTKRDAVRLLDIPAEKIDVIPLGSTLKNVSPAPCPQPPAPNSPTRYVLALGLGDPRKNAATAIETVKELREEKRYEDLRLVLVGEKNANVISSLSRNLPSGRSLRVGRDDNCSWIQTVPHPTDPEISALYAGASAFLYPSWYEGYGLPLHEAASFGTPCIASTAGALPETAPPGTLFVNPAKPHHWTEALKLALALPKSGPAPESRAWGTAALVLRSALDET
jgi:glycosyltransferase involved in cell wall biosynthesis